MLGSLYTLLRRICIHLTYRSCLIPPPWDPTHCDSYHGIEVAVAMASSVTKWLLIVDVTRLPCAPAIARNISFDRRRPQQAKRPGLTTPYTSPLKRAMRDSPNPPSEVGFRASMPKYYDLRTFSLVPKAIVATFASGVTWRAMSGRSSSYDSYNSALIYTPRRRDARDSLLERHRPTFET